MGCCVGDCCVIDCGFCCIFDCGDCGDMKIEEVIAKQFAIVDSEIRNRLKEVDLSMKNALNEI